MKKRTSYTVDTVFVLVLFAVFAITVLFVLMSGAGVYKDTQMVMQERYEQRTCLSYISAKVNHHDEADSVHIQNFDGISALALDEKVGNQTYVTYIYCYDGHVKELLFAKDLVFDPAVGNDIIPAKDLEFSKDGNLINVTCTGTDGTDSSLSLRVESGLEVAS